MLSVEIVLGHAVLAVLPELYTRYRKPSQPPDEPDQKNKDPLPRDEAKWSLRDASRRSAVRFARGMGLTMVGADVTEDPTLQ